MGEKVKLKLLTFSEVIDPFLMFKDPLQIVEYNKFCEDRISLRVTSIILLLYGVYVGYEIAILSTAPQLPVYALWTATAVYATLIPLSLSFIFGSGHPNYEQRNKVEHIVKFLICGVSGMFCALSDVNRVMLGHPRAILLSPEAIVWIITPLLLTIVFHSTEWLSALYSMVSGIFCMSVLNWNNFTQTSGSAVVFYIAMSVCVTYEYRRQSLAKFLLNQNFKFALSENERMADELHATEMRHMIANVAHDLKTPLAGFVHVNEIVSNIVADCEEKYAAQTLTPEEMLEYIQSLRSCVKTTQSINTFMLMTINRCIDYTKASQGLKLVPYFGTVNLFDSLILPLSVMRDIQSKIQITLIDIPPSICTHIITDYQWIQENILCLLSNAIKYSSGGVVTIAIDLFSLASVQARVRKYESSPATPLSPLTTTSSSNTKGTTNAEEQQMLLVEIEDNGIGLSDADMSNLFNPFKQAQRLTGGTGLGLYSLAKRIEALGGFYGVQKRHDGGKGSRFWFAMPYRPDFQSAEESLKPMNAATPHPIKISPPTSIGSAGKMSVANCEHNDAIPASLHVLIVDDSMPILKLTTMLLKRNGHTTAQAENGSDAVDMLLATSQAFDVVLMDLQMPVMDGFEATRRIRARELEAEQTRLASTTLRLNVSRTLPVHQTIIGMSANSDSDTINEAFAAGMDAFMAKPFALKTFYENVQRMGKGGASSLPSPGDGMLGKPPSI